MTISQFRGTSRDKPLCTLTLHQQALPRDARYHSRMRRQAPYMPHALNLQHTEKLGLYNDESEDSNGDSEFDAFAEEQDSS